MQLSGWATTVEICLIILVATTFRTAFGFGEALIAVPLLSLVLPVKVAAPVAVLASIVIALVVVIRDWKHIHFRAARGLLLSTLFGLPLGLWLLRYAPEGITKGTLGLFLLMFSSFSLCKSDWFVLPDERWIWLFGFLAGVTGGSYGMNGPPLVLYGAGRQWAPRQFRATLQAYFLPASCLGMAGYGVSGLWNREVNTIFIYSLPAVVTGIFLGGLAHKKLDSWRSARLLYGALVVVAVGLLVQALNVLNPPT